MRAVLDTDVFISGLMLPKRTPAKIITAWRTGHFALVLSEPMLAAISTVLGYPKIKMRIAWDDDTVGRYVSLLRFEAQIVDIAKTQARVPRDAKDNMVLATLIASEADCLVTGDLDLRALANAYSIITPAEFVARIF